MKFLNFLNDDIKVSSKFKTFYNFYKKYPDVVFVRGLYGTFESGKELKVEKNRKPKRYRYWNL